MTTPSPNPQPSPERPPEKPSSRTDPGQADPSLTPPAVAQPPDWNYSGIDPKLMSEFERGLGQAEAALGRHEPRIRRTLEDLDLDTSRLNALRELGNWIGAKRPELRRRNETIQAAKPEWGAAGAGGMTPFDERLYSAASGKPDVYAAALKLGELDRNGEVDEKTVAELEKRAGDPEFATSLMHALGTEKFRHLAAALVYHKDERKQRLQAALGKALGAASPRLSESWRKELLDNLRVPVDQHALAAVLPYGKFNRDFLVAAAKTLEGLDRKTWNERPATGTPHDPMIGVMKALANHPKAAQDVFVGDPSIMKRYVTERPMLDDGVAFGAAVEAATLTYRDRDGSPQNPSPGFTSAAIASDFIRWEAERVLAGTEGPSFATTGSTARILAAYMNDVGRAAKTPLPGSSDVSGAGRPHLPDEDQVWGAQFRREDLRKVMADAFKHDPKALATVTAAQIAWSRRLLSHGAMEAAGGGGKQALMAHAREAGATFGLITDASGLAGIQKGKELDEAQERNLKIIMAAANVGLAIPQAPAWSITAGVVGAWTGLIEDSAKTQRNEDEGVYDANMAKERARFLLDQLAVDAMLGHGLFGKPDGSSHPWSSLDGVDKGEDPRKSSNNFLKDDGNSLMTLHEMAPYPGSAQPRLDSYRRWLYDGLAGDEWKSIEDELSKGFEMGFSEHKPR
ncbi:hypothetical protein OUY22_06590 [Nonomuraea sp. MCN248]|uniref:Uncharacterized protein n=1 Tax=Nonomuraea corallina TaxID=2989783 RepID=A0ABT4S799_9ACTN|nr:DUF6571 family protein [Nonomuraea corallina]MDA0633083.1 hypothetical protein [Nonomuraea corallina]